MAINDNQNQMNRGVNQALYRYLPGRWIDFFRKESRENFSAYVTNWNGTALQGINNKRLLRVVSQAVRTFQREHQEIYGVDPLVGFGSNIDETTYQVLTPKVSDKIMAVAATVSPLVFHCEKCHKVKQYYNSRTYFENKAKNYCCGKPMTQIRLIRYCKCGYAEAVYMGKCKTHGYEYIIRDGDFGFVCTKCHERIPMKRSCPECKAPDMVVKPALDSGHYFPFNVSIIDLLDKKKDLFLENESASDSCNGELVVIGHLMGLISDDDYYEVINQGSIKKESELNMEIEKERESYTSMGIPEEYINTILEKKYNDSSSTKISGAISEVKTVLSNLERDNIRSIAEEIMEYEELKSPRSKNTLEDAIEMARQLDANANPESYRSLATKFGIKEAQVCSNVPIIFSAFGFTRKDREASVEGIKLRGFPEEEKGKKNIYAAKLETEGVLFEFNKLRIVEWLLKNNYITEKDAPLTMSEKDLSAWFVDNIKLSEIKAFVGINDQINPLTSIVYKLIHTISHVLIRQASEICGLDRSSLAEYILPNIPAIFIYCQNSQGFNMGALFNAFQASFDKWLLSAKQDVEKCIFDPICIDGNKACAGCLFLNEVSCQHFNKDLDRSLLIGWYDKINKRRHFGFWEE